VILSVFSTQATGDDKTDASPSAHGRVAMEALESTVLAGNLLGIGPVIVVMPDAGTVLGGVWYVNSAANGRWETFIAEDLVAFIDAKYRTRRF